MGFLLGYARVSTAEQNADLQTDELTAAGWSRVYVDHASGALDRRPQLDRVLEDLRPGDRLVVWRLDRLGRSLRHLVDTVTPRTSGRSGFGRCGRRSTPRPRVVGWCSTCSGRSPNLNGRSLEIGLWRDSPRPGPAAGSGAGRRS